MSEKSSPLGDFGVQACLHCVNLLRNVPCQSIFLHKPLTALPHDNVKQGVSKGGENRRRRHVGRGILRLVSQSQAGPGWGDLSRGSAAAAAALVLSIEVEAACRAMLLPSLGNTKLCLPTNRDITLVMTQSAVVRPQGAPCQFSALPSSQNSSCHIGLSVQFQAQDRDDFVINRTKGE